MAAGRDPWLQSGLDFGTAEIQNLLYILYIDEEHHANFESICWYISPVPQSPLQASPMNVDHALGVPIFKDFQNASECIRSHGPDSCCIMGVKGKVADRLSQADLPFHALEFVRSDHGIWALENNAASLPLGCLSSTSWIRRLQSVSILRPVDAGSPWTWKGRIMSNSVLVRFYVVEEGNDAGFDVRGQDAHFTSQSLVGHEDLGELLPGSA